MNVCRMKILLVKKCLQDLDRLRQSLSSFVRNEKISEDTYVSSQMDVEDFLKLSSVGTLSNTVSIVLKFQLEMRLNLHFRVSKLFLPHSSVCEVVC